MESKKCSTAGENENENEIGLGDGGNGSTKKPPKKLRTGDENQSGSSSSNRPNEEGPAKVAADFLVMPNGDRIPVEEILKLGGKEADTLLKELFLQAEINARQELVLDEENERTYMEIVEHKAKMYGISIDACKAKLRSSNGPFAGLEHLFFKVRTVGPNEPYDPSSIIGGFEKAVLDYRKAKGETVEKSTQEEPEGSSRD